MNSTFAITYKIYIRCIYYNNNRKITTTSTSAIRVTG